MIDKITDVINEIYDSGEIPEDLSRTVFIVMRKKLGENECKFHLAISLNHIIN